MKPTWIIGIDVGGTNTDAVLMCDQSIKHSCKVPTTPDITSGINEAIKIILEHQLCEKEQIKAVIVGTTHLINAVIQRKLQPVLALRLGAPATTAAKPGIDWEPSLYRQILDDHAFVVKGGYEFNNKPISDLDQSEIETHISDAQAKGIQSVAVTGVFSHINKDQENKVGSWISEHGMAASLSHQLGGLGLLARENATIINASLAQVFSQLCDAMQEVKSSLTLDQVKFFLCSSAGTVEEITAESGFLPLSMLHSGPTNSIRGAGLVSNTKNAVVVDVGGTTTDIGVLINGFPVVENIATEIADGTQIDCFIQRPRTLSTSLGGGTIIDITENGQLQLSDRSVALELSTKAICFGGDVITLSDIALAAGTMTTDTLGRVDQKTIITRIQDKIEATKTRFHAHDHLDYQSNMAQLNEQIYAKISSAIIHMIATLEQPPTSLLLIGGGAALFDTKVLQDRLQRHDSNLRVSVPQNAGVINAAGAAQAQKGYSLNCTVDYAKEKRSEVIREKVTEGVRQLLAEGAINIELSYGGLREVPMNYLPGDPNQLSLHFVGDMTWEIEANESSPDSTVKKILKNLSLKDTNTKNEQISAQLAKPQLSRLDPYQRQHQATSPQSQPTLDPRYLSQLTSDDIEWIAKGAGFLGSGGGGSPDLGRKIAQQILANDGCIKLIDPKHLPPDAHIVAFGVMGSPTVLSERLPSLHEGRTVIEALERMTGRKVDAIIPMEGGGTNATYPFLAAAERNIPIVDGDYMGRAFPGINMVTPSIYGQESDLNMTLTHHSGDATSGQAIQLKEGCFADLEHKARQHTIDFGGIVTMAYIPLSGRECQELCLQNTLTKAKAIGRSITQSSGSIAKRCHDLNKLEDIAEYGPVQVITKGRVINVLRREKDGFSLGGIVIEEDQSQHSNSRITIGFQNENLFAIKECNKKISYIAQVPEVIVVVDNNTGKAISCEEFSFGQEVLLLKMACPARLETTKALTTLGPQAYPIPQIMQLLGITPIDSKPKVVQCQTVTALESSATLNLALLVSLGQSYYEGEKLIAILRYLKFIQNQRPQTKITVVVADTLQTHNALDPKQINRPGEIRMVEKWVLKKVENEKMLRHEQKGTIHYVQYGTRIKYCGYFGHYSMIPVQGCADQLELHRRKLPGTGATHQRGFSGILDLSIIGAELKTADVLNHVAQQTGKDWVKRYQNHLGGLHVVHWDSYSRRDSNIQKYQEMLAEDFKFRAYFFNKIALYRSARNRCDATEEKMWKDYHNQFEQKRNSDDTTWAQWQPLTTLSEQHAKLWDDETTLPTHLSYTARYILEETAILMDQWAGQFSHILYDGEEPFFDYCRNLNQSTTPPIASPQWTNYETKDSILGVANQKTSDLLPLDIRMLQKEEQSSSEPGTKNSTETLELVTHQHVLAYINHQHPSSILIYGPKGSGKSTWCQQLPNALKHQTKIVHCFIMTAEEYSSKKPDVITQLLDRRNLSEEQLLNACVMIFDGYNQLNEKEKETADTFIECASKRLKAVIVTTTTKESKPSTIKFTKDIVCQGFDRSNAKKHVGHGLSPALLGNPRLLSMYLVSKKQGISITEIIERHIGQQVTYEYCIDIQREGAQQPASTQATSHEFSIWFKLKKNKKIALLQTPCVLGNPKAKFTLKLNWNRNSQVQESVLMTSKDRTIALSEPTGMVDWERTKCGDALLFKNGTKKKKLDAELKPVFTGLLLDDIDREHAVLNEYYDNETAEQWNPDQDERPSLHYLTQNLSPEPGPEPGPEQARVHDLYMDFLKARNIANKITKLEKFSKKIKESFLNGLYHKSIEKQYGRIGKNNFFFWVMIIELIPPSSSLWMVKKILDDMLTGNTQPNHHSMHSLPVTADEAYHFFVLITHIGKTGKKKSQLNNSIQERLAETGEWRQKISTLAQTRWPSGASCGSKSQHNASSKSCDCNTCTLKCTPAHTALSAHYKDTETFKTILPFLSSPHIEDSNDENFSHHMAAQDINPDLIVGPSITPDAFTQMLTAQNRWGTSPVTVAAMKGSKQFFEKAIKHLKANQILPMMEHRGRTLLCSIIQSENTPLIHFFLRKLIEWKQKKVIIKNDLAEYLETPDHRGNTAMHHALLTSNDEILLMYMNAVRKMMPPHSKGQVVNSDHANLIDLLIAPDKTIGTPLYHCYRSTNPHLVSSYLSLTAEYLPKPMFFHMLMANRLNTKIDENGQIGFSAPQASMRAYFDALRSLLRTARLDTSDYRLLLTSTHAGFDYLHSIANLNCAAHGNDHTDALFSVALKHIQWAHREQYLNDQSLLQIVTNQNDSGFTLFHTILNKRSLSCTQEYIAFMTTLQDAKIISADQWKEYVLRPVNQPRFYPLDSVLDRDDSDILAEYLELITKSGVDRRNLQFIFNENTLKRAFSKRYGHLQRIIGFIDQNRLSSELNAELGHLPILQEAIRSNSADILNTYLSRCSSEQLRVLISEHNFAIIRDIYQNRNIEQLTKLCDHLKVKLLLNFPKIFDLLTTANGLQQINFYVSSETPMSLWQQQYHKQLKIFANGKEDSLNKIRDQFTRTAPELPSIAHYLATHHDEDLMQEYCTILIESIKLPANVVYQLLSGEHGPGGFTPLSNMVKNAANCTVFSNFYNTLRSSQFSQYRETTLNMLFCWQVWHGALKSQNIALVQRVHHLMIEELKTLSLEEKREKIERLLSGTESSLAIALEQEPQSFVIGALRMLFEFIARIKPFLSNDNYVSEIGDDESGSILCRITELNSKEIFDEYWQIVPNIMFHMTPNARAEVMNKALKNCNAYITRKLLSHLVKNDLVMNYMAHHYRINAGLVHGIIKCNDHQLVVIFSQALQKSKKEQISPILEGKHSHDFYNSPLMTAIKYRNFQVFDELLTLLYQAFTHGALSNQSLAMILTARNSDGFNALMSTISLQDIKWLKAYKKLLIHAIERGAISKREYQELLLALNTDGWNICHSAAYKKYDILEMYLKLVAAMTPQRMHWLTTHKNIHGIQPGCGAGADKKVINDLLSECRTKVIPSAVTKHQNEAKLPTAGHQRWRVDHVKSMPDEEYMARIDQCVKQPNGHLLAICSLEAKLTNSDIPALPYLQRLGKLYNEQAQKVQSNQPYYYLKALSIFSEALQYQANNHFALHGLIVSLYNLKWFTECVAKCAQYQQHVGTRNKTVNNCLEWSQNELKYKAKLERTPYSAHNYMYNTVSGKKSQPTTTKPRPISSAKNQFSALFGLTDDSAIEVPHESRVDLMTHGSAAITTGNVATTDATEHSSDEGWMEAPATTSGRRYRSRLFGKQHQPQQGSQSHKPGKNY